MVVRVLHPPTPSGVFAISLSKLQLLDQVGFIHRIHLCHSYVKSNGLFQMFSGIGLAVICMLITQIGVNTWIIPVFDLNVYPAWAPNTSSTT